MRIIDEVATHGEAGSGDFSFLWSFGADKPSVGWFLEAFFVMDEIDGVGAFDASTNTLGEAAEFVGSRVAPDGFGGRIADELTILLGFAGGGINDGVHGVERLGDWWDFEDGTQLGIGRSLGR